jgi:hypothetical protein
MSYEIVKVINEQNDELGWAITKDNMLKLTSVHLHESYFAAKEEVATLNKKALLSNFWPNPDDPEVKAIMNDPDFYSIDQLQEHDSSLRPQRIHEQENDPSYPSFQRLYEACSLVAHRRAGL